MRGKPQADSATRPRPRRVGHRAKGKGTSGGLLYARLAAAVRAAGVRVLTQTTARELVTDPGGRVTGVACTTPARRARLGPAGAPGAAPLVGEALPVRAEGSAGSCTARWPGWSGATDGRCGSSRPAAWSSRPAASPRTGR